ncbi:alanine/glycine:cation symporter family protein [Gayadomonas joobiniege]|uniref:alanine/glycine:cation symporter family protein n=1 Tax=Gayadomonas joobiniege TaxID=1234606 RepID=UPI000378F3DF|nr:amino acid carrier protein [Gayadomonas joobiniege]
MQEINQFLLLLDQYLGSAWYFPYLLLATGLFFTIYLSFPQFKLFRLGCRRLFSKNSSGPGETSHFQALSTALSGTVGTGNIGGVALAIYLGGPAALFWMWVTAFLGMATKYVEVSLSHKYRERLADGSVSGGPMYYMRDRLKSPKLAAIFALAVVISSFGTGSMPQINNIALAMETTFAIPNYVTGLVLASLLGFVILGGIKRIAQVTSKIVPLMAGVYVMASLLIIVSHYENILPSLQIVFASAFTGTAATGGFLGASFAYAFSRGVNRGLFSNEAGAGSSAIAHASARTKQPIEEGAVALLEPFIDTLILCTLTGLVILATGSWQQKHLNTFDRADMYVIEGQYQSPNKSEQQALSKWLNKQNDHDIRLYSGQLNVDGGALTNEKVTIINARSIAEQVQITHNGAPYSGSVQIIDGKLVDSDVQVSGLSLLHSTALTAVAFNQGWLTGFGEYVVAICILLFAFSSSISWSYYGDRAMVFLFGSRSVVLYRGCYVLGFFLAAILDTTFIWNLAAITIVFMTLPNILAILCLSREMRQTQTAYHKHNKEEQ